MSPATTPGFPLLLAILATAICTIPLATAQTGPQAALIPPCVKTCDPPAIASVNCTLEDQYCHCVRQDGILTNISACAESSCEEPAKDLFVFTTLFQDVCRKFNISVPILGSGGDGDGDGTNGTLSPAGNDTTNAANASSSAIPSPYMGAANGVYVPAQMAWTVFAGLVVLTMLGALLL